MADDMDNGRHGPTDPNALTPDALERQAREAMAQIRAHFGELGSRVRKVVERAGEHWEAAAPIAGAGDAQVPAEKKQRARALAQRWADIDFLVDPELPAAMTVVGYEEAALWRVELRERGETRLLEERTSPYRGDQPPEAHQPRPLWDYNFPLTPEIEAGERRERLPGAGSVLACSACHGAGHHVCRACEGSGHVMCPRCHGSGALTCPRCRGRGRLSPPRGGTPDVRLHVERLIREASDRAAELSEHVQREWGKRHAPLFDWTPASEEHGESIPCPDCHGGKVACDCDHGKRVCAVCHGSGQEECAHCRGSGRVVRHSEVVRRFDTRLGTRALPLDDGIAAWAPAETVGRGNGEQIWSGGLDEARASHPVPDGVSSQVWGELVAFAAAAPAAGGAGPDPTAERRVIARRLALARIPLTRIDYEFAGKRYVVTSYGTAGEERFWAERFPHRWSRVGRFLKAVSRDLGEPRTPPPTPPGNGQAGQVTELDAYRARRDASSDSTE